MTPKALSAFFSLLSSQGPPPLTGSHKVVVEGCCGVAPPAARVSSCNMTASTIKLLVILSSKRWDVKCKSVQKGAGVNWYKQGWKSQDLFHFLSDVSEGRQKQAGSQLGAGVMQSAPGAARVRVLPSRCQCVRQLSTRLC